MKRMNDILPLELIQAILLRVPARNLFRLKLVSKLWHSLISNPEFVELHLQRSSALTPPAFFFAKSSEQARLVDLHALINEDATIGAAIKDVPIPSVKKKKHRFRIQVLGSCRGFVLLHYEPRFILWNPVTGYSKQISHRCDFKKRVCLFQGAILYGVGYDASNDDYLIRHPYLRYTVYTESLATLPCDCDTKKCAKSTQISVAWVLPEDLFSQE
ncbi:hypothetical protein PIB30_072803, partial [Stylosanthes scabra]|nr:hypothetical protein [Stylosanthes scabra]